MGALHSLQQKFSEVTLIEEEMEESDSTPTKTASLRHKRLLALDPRSPSEGIARTPIMVDQTPKPGNTRTLANNANETPKGVPATKDPRSPTNEFLRTPINPCMATVSRQANPGLSLENTPMTGKGYDSESGIESAEVTPNVQYEKTEGDANSNQTESPDSALNEKVGDLNSCASGRDNNLQSHDFECCQSSSSSTDVDTAPLIDDSDESSESGESPQKGKNQTSSIPLVSVKPKSDESTPKLRGVVKSSSQTIVNKNTGSLSLTPGVTRSPLSLVKNSSSTLSQRSKMTPRGGKSGYAMTSRVIDKENIFH